MATSIAELQEIVAHNSVSMGELHALMKEVHLAQKETDQEIKRTQREVRLAQQEMWLAHKETELSMQELQRVHRETELAVHKLTKSVGGLNNDIGEIVEMIVLPGLKQKINDFNHCFTIGSPRKEFSKKNGEPLTEVDLLLENCEEVMVVEVKTQFSTKWMKRFIKKLEILRKNEAITGMAGKVMYAAAAGISFDAEALDMVEEQRMYLVQIEEDSDRINITPPKGKAGIW